MKHDVKPALASGHQLAGSDRSTELFGPDSETNVSPIVTVNDELAVVRAFNLADGDLVLVEMIDGEGAGRVFAPFCPGGGQQYLRSDRNVLCIDIPGRYRFVLHREDDVAPPVGVATVRMTLHPMTRSRVSVAHACCKGDV